MAPIEDDDEYELLPPKRPATPEPPKPLPRLWKVEQEAAEAAAAAAAAAAEGVQSPPTKGKPPGTTSSATPQKNPRPARSEPVRQGAGSQPPAARPTAPKAAPSRREQREAETEEPKRKGVLIEETPELDTYEARQRVRLLISLVVGALCLAGIAVLVLPYLTSSEENFDNLPDEGVLAAKAGPATPREGASELEARNMFDNARQLASNGKPKDAVAMLNKIVASYPKTKTATAAKEAIARPGQNPPLPLFLDESRATIVAAGPGNATSNGDPAGSTAPSLAAIDTIPGKGQRSTTADAQLHLPRNPDEAGTKPATSGGGATSSTVVVKPLPVGFHAMTEAGVHKSGWPQIIAADRDGAPMVFIPPGTFRMGRDDGSPEEAPAHTVNLGAYYIDQHEVTVRMWNLFAGETSAKPVSAASLKKDGVGTEFSSNHPIVLVSARDAANYCEWAGKKLPTEAQWEKAARTTDGRVFPWGSAEPTWIRPRHSKQIDMVMAYELDQSPYGVFDMAGNAWEWTADYYDPAYFKLFKSTTAVNPTGPQPKARNPQLVLKGGSKTWQVTWREGLKPETKYPFVGFRGVLTVEDAPISIDAPSGGAAPASVPTSGAPQPKSKAARPSGGVIPF